jgi:methionyl-tRNA formyltransferase
MQMEEGLDTGAMLSKAALTIVDTDTSATLYEKLAEIGPAALLAALNDLPALQRQAQAQEDTHASYAEKLSKEEALLDFTKPAAALAREIRAFNPWPVR